MQKSTISILDDNAILTFTEWKNKELSAEDWTIKWGHAGKYRRIKLSWFI